MATIHLYCRTQITTDDPGPITAAVDALCAAVAAAGGDAHAVRATIDDPDAPAPSSAAPAAPTHEGPGPLSITAAPGAAAEEPDVSR